MLSGQLLQHPLLSRSCQPTFTLLLQDNDVNVKDDDDDDDDDNDDDDDDDDIDSKPDYCVDTVYLEILCCSVGRLMITQSRTLDCTLYMSTLNPN